MADSLSDQQRQPSPETVRRSLRALVEGGAADCRCRPAGTAPTRPVGSPPADVVEAAERAAADAREAATFLSDGRLPELDAAITTAAARGDDAVAERGRTAREPLRRLDAALTARSE
jgi:hypothetical protein